MDISSIKEFLDRPLVKGIAVSSLLVALGFGLYRRWAGGNICTSKAKLTGKTAIVTGANAGIGLETAVELAKRGARVILACRSPEKGEAAVTETRRRSGNDDVAFARLDLASLSSVHSFSKKILREEEHVHILVNNAGVAIGRYEVTVDGFERQMGVNYLGHFLLTNLLLDRMRKTPNQTRIVFLSSTLYKTSPKFDFAGMNSSDPSRFNKSRPGRAYSQSKLATILFSRALSRRVKDGDVGTFVLCPGVVRTGLFYNYRKYSSRLFTLFLHVLMYIVLKSPWQGCQTVVYCAVAEELEGKSGGFYRNCQERELETKVAKDDVVAEELWRVSAEMVGLNAQS